jgi:hypothetical protein
MLGLGDGGTADGLGAGGTLAAAWLAGGLALHAAATNNNRATAPSAPTLDRAI